MEIIKFSRVLSVNSEIPNHEAKNLLDSEVTIQKSWLCSKGSEKGIIILKLERATVISKVDLGNAHSAFIEVLVGTAADSSDQFLSLVPTSTFMSPNESKVSENQNKVRFFKTEDFDPVATGKKWDLLKIVCSQPFNKHVPFGVCFVKVHGERLNDKEGPSFLKTTEDTGIAVGSFFRRKKESSGEGDKKLSISEQIRKAEQPESLAKRTPLSTSKLHSKFPEKSPSTSSKRVNIDDDMAQDNRKNRDLGLDEPSPKKRKEDSSSQENSAKDRKQREAEEAYEKRKKEREADDVLRKEKREKERLEQSKKDEEDAKRRRKEREEEENAKKKAREERQKNAKLHKEKKRKPFNKLLDGVVFVLSGFQNPERGTYRSHAIEMGAKYCQDWIDNRCTHLIAAFINTPKCKQVRGKGKIVSSDWIEKCYSHKKRYPWRRFALDKRERNQPESEEEIYLLRDTSPASVEPSASTSSTGHGPSQLSPSHDDEKFNASTDEEQEEESVPSLPDFFQKNIFYVDDTIGDKDVLERYIIAYNGTISDKLDDSVQYFITMQRGQTLDLLKKNATRFKAVSPTWIQSINCNKKYVTAENFILD